MFYILFYYWQVTCYLRFAIESANFINKEYMEMLKKLLMVAVLATASLTTKANIIVDLELQLLADVSGSVDSSEYSLQLNGYADAFRSQDVINTILAGSNGQIAVQYIEWSNAADQAIQIDWTLIDSAQAALDFADDLAALSRAFSSFTAVGSAIEFGATQFATNGFDSTRQVMDISGDGNQNRGINTATARDNALAGGIDTINGITIGTENGLQDFYQNNVIGGVGAFHLHAATFADFEAGIERKLIKEIRQVPTPATIALFGLALAALSLRKRS